jgi:hypothetical protein
MVGEKAGSKAQHRNTVRPTSDETKRANRSVSDPSQWSVCGDRATDVFVSVFIGNQKRKRKRKTGIEKMGRRREGEAAD